MRRAVATVAPLAQDPSGIDAAMVFAEAGIPIIFFSMPTLGSTAPSTLAGVLLLAPRMSRRASRQRSASYRRSGTTGFV